jgi:hypothetical protein
MAKSILSADRNNLVLWDGYARLERQRGNTDAARAVYVAALQAAQVKRDPASNIAGETSADEDELWSAWSEMEWEEGNESRCVEVLVMATGMELSKLGPLHCPRSDNADGEIQKGAWILHTLLPAPRLSQCSDPVK